jgi:hypothetical protein
MKQGKEKKEFDPAREWDVITATTDGGVVWKNYASGSAHRIVVTHKGENPNDVADREDEEKRKSLETSISATNVTVQHD